MITVSTIKDLAKEVLTIEANSILRLIENIGDDFGRAIDILYNCKKSNSEIMYNV